MLKLKGTKTIASFDGANIFYQHDFSGGRDNVLILLHGLGGDLSTWKKEEAVLHDLGHSTIAMDLRGHGESDRLADASEYRLEDFSQDVLKIIEHENIQKAVIVGHCLGGMIAMHVGSLKSPNVKGLSLIDLGYKPPYWAKQVADTRVLRWIVDLMIKHGSDAHLASRLEFAPDYYAADWDWPRIIKNVMHTSVRSYLSVCESIMDFDGLELVKKIDCPTLVVVGGEDQILPPKQQKLLAKRLLNGEVYEIKTGNHIIVLNNPTDLSQAIDSYIKRHKIFA